jgi:hypothetical protein
LNLRIRTVRAKLGLVGGVNCEGPLTGNRIRRLRFSSATAEIFGAQFTLAIISTHLRLLFVAAPSGVIASIVAL